MEKSFDIAIAGAGPAGLATALYLKRAGHNVTIFERFEEPKPVGSGLILQPTGLSVLADLGLLDDILALGSRIERLHGADASTGRTVLDVAMMPNAVAALGWRCTDGSVRRALRAVQRSRSPSRRVSRSRLWRPANGRLICGNGRGRAVRSGRDASGSRSKLRQCTGNAGAPRPLTYGTFWASLRWRGEGFDEHALLQRYDKASVMIGVLPIGRPGPGAEKMAAFFWSLKPADADEVRAGGLDAWKERVVALWPESEAYTSQIEDFDQLSLARYGHHTMKLPVGRQLAVIGDAAHSTSPQLGQGANMSLLDAAALADALERAPHVEAALEAYAKARRWHVRVFQALSLAFTPFYQSDSVALPFIRGRLVATVARIPPAPQFLASMVAGTVIDPFRRIGLAEARWQDRSGGELLKDAIPSPAEKHGGVADSQG